MCLPTPAHPTIQLAQTAKYSAEPIRRVMGELLSLAFVWAGSIILVQSFMLANCERPVCLHAGDTQLLPTGAP